MPEDTKPQLEWVPSRNGEMPEIYTNYIHATWTLFDVRVRLGHLIPVPKAQRTEGSNNFAVEEMGAVTFSWAQAKFIRDSLVRLVESYEKTNGEIKPLKLPPDPSGSE
jgi:hypothetical protein